MNARKLTMITLKNPRTPDLQPIEIDALADTDPFIYAFRSHRLQLRFKECDRKRLPSLMAARG